MDHTQKECQNQNKSDKPTLSPREERVGREPERGAASPPSDGREGEKSCCTISDILFEVRSSGLDSVVSHYLKVCAQTIDSDDDLASVSGNFVDVRHRSPLQAIISPT